MKVTIDGKDFIPEEKSAPKIGIAVSTRQRHAVLASTLIKHFEFLPENVYFVVVDDGSSPPVEAPEWATVIRHEESRGIVEAKNTSLHALIEAGCEQLFLWDDDAYPIAQGWEKPYIDSPEPHLCYQFLDLKSNRRLNDIAEVYRDNALVAYTGQRGVMLYYHKSAIDVVGGFDRVYQRGMYEHVDLALRINNAGLTTWAYADVAGSDKLIYSLDEWEKVARSVPPPEREAQVARNVKIFNHRRDTFYSGYADYKPINKAVITVLLSGTPDPQRNGQKMAANGALVSTWAKSILSGKKIVIADQATSIPGVTDVEFIKVPEKADVSPYFLRWMHIYQYLREHPELTDIWITDGTDVVMSRNPWEEMDPEVLYVGDEHSTYRNPWFNKVNAHAELREFIANNIDAQVINAGLIGGKRDRVMLVIQGILRIYAMVKSRQFWTTKKVTEIPTDMVIFGIAVQKFGGKTEHGPRVNSVFKSNGHGKDYAWWIHK